MKSLGYVFIFAFLSTELFYAGEVEKILINLKQEQQIITQKINHENGEPIYEVQPFESIQRNHYDERNKEGKIKYLVMHYTHANFKRTMDIFTANKNSGRVSAHYVITQKEEEPDNVPGGMIFGIVPEEKRAWHAGISHWNGVENLNHESIGIENVNRGFEEQAEGKKWFAFDTLQVKALGKLSRKIIEKYQIKPNNIVGHADIAPDRKQDPGILFPWQELYEKYGIGAWLENDTEAYINKTYIPKEKLSHGVSDSFCLTQLKNYGYKIENPGYNTPENQEAVKAFKSHFSQNQNPKNYDGLIAQSDMRWGWGLVAKYTKE